MSSFFIICLLLTVGNLVYLSQKKYKTTDRYLWTIILLFPVVILGYWIKSTVHTADAATVAFCFIYLDSTVLPVVLLFSMLKSMDIKVSPWVKLSAYALTSLHLLTVWISRDTNLYYASVTLTESLQGTSTRMTPGPLKITHYIFLAVLTIAFTSTLVMGFVLSFRCTRVI